MATITKTGVKFLKINKVDGLGNNKDAILKELQSIRINFPDIGVKDYPIQATTEYPTYYLYQLDYVNATSSVYTGVNDYRSIASSSFNPSYGYTSANTLQEGLVTFFDTITKTSNYVNANGWYQIPTTEHYPNTGLTITASVDFNVLSPTANPSLFIVNYLEPDITFAQAYKNNIDGTGTLTISMSLFDEESGLAEAVRSGVYLGLAVYNNSTNPVNFLNPRVVVNQTVNSGSSTQLLAIPSPDTDALFVGTDCDVTYGWADQVPYSQYYMDIDYANNATIPVNQQALISGTATPALVKDYYYGMRRHTLPRYEGSRASSLKYNEYTGPIDDNINIGTPYGNYPLEGYQGDTAFGKTAAIDQYQSYAARFQYIAGYGPEMYNALLVYVTDIVDELGNVQQPKLDNPSYYNLTNAFEQGEQATVKLLDAQGNTQFAGLNNTFNIIRAGKRLETPLYTYTGSQTYTSTPTPLAGISFQGDANTPRFTNKIYSSSVQWTGTATTINTNFVALISASTTTRTNPRFVSNSGYKLQPGDSASYSPLKFTLNNLKVSIAAGYTGYDNWVNIKFVSSSADPDVFPNNIGVPYSVIEDFGDRRVAAGSGITTIEEIVANSVQVSEQFYYYFIIAASNFGSYAPALNSYELSVDAIYPYNTGGPSDVIYNTDLYFITSSTNRSILSASSILTSYYGKTQVYDSTAGFNPPIPFTIQEGDEIRFGGNELYSHMIYNVQQGPNITFNLLPPLSNQEYNMATVNAASIRRYTDDPNTIIIAGNKAAGGTPGGIIKPKYTTKALEDVIDSNPLFTLQSGLSSS